MTNQRIYNVPPRMAGPVAGWSGLESPTGESWLLNHVRDLGFNAIHFNPLSEPTQVEKDFNGKMSTRSYYAIRNHFALNAELSCGDADLDRAHLKHFNDKAREMGVTVYADAVFNHIAADHPLVLDENAQIARVLAATQGNAARVYGDDGKVAGLTYMTGGKAETLMLKFKRLDNPALSLSVGGTPDNPWSDVAEINYASPAARAFFVDGDGQNAGFLKQVIDRHLDDGFTAFRCDAAYNLPPKIWESLAAHARARAPDCTFWAETTGADWNHVRAMANARTTGADGRSRPVFDLGQIDTNVWDYTSEWLPKGQIPLIESMAKYGGIGAPDHHDTPDTLAGGLRKKFNCTLPGPAADQAIAAASVRDWAVASLACNSSLMQMGYELCNEKQNGVFAGQVEPSDWKNLNARAGTPLDISGRIREINALKASLPTDNCHAHITLTKRLQGGSLVEMQCEYLDIDTGKEVAKIALLLNMDPDRNRRVALLPETSKGLEDAGLLLHGAPGTTPLFVEDVMIFCARAPGAAASGLNQAAAQPKLRAVNG